MFGPENASLQLDIIEFKKWSNFNCNNLLLLLYFNENESVLWSGFI